MVVEQPIDRIRLFQTDRHVGALFTFAKLADVPHGNPMRRQKGQPFCITQSRPLIEQSKDDGPEQVARVGVIFAPAQRLFTREGAQDEHARLSVDGRRKAAFGGGSRCAAAGAASHSTYRPRRTAVWPLARRRDGMISTQSS